MLNLFKKKETVVKPVAPYIPPEQPEYEDYLELLIDVNKSAYILGKQTKDEYLAMRSALGDILDRAEARRCADDTSELEDMIKRINEQAKRDGYLELNEKGVPVMCFGENYRKIRDLKMSGWNNNLNLEFCWPPATFDFSKEEIAIASDSSPQEKQPL